MTPTIAADQIDALCRRTPAVRFNISITAEMRWLLAALFAHCSLFSAHATSGHVHAGNKDAIFLAMARAAKAGANR